MHLICFTSPSDGEPYTIDVENVETSRLHSFLMDYRYYNIDGRYDLKQFVRESEPTVRVQYGSGKRLRNLRIHRLKDPFLELGKHFLAHRQKWFYGD